MSDRFGSAAYEDLLAAAMYGHSLSEAQNLIADFAHELAELQRLRMDELDLTGQKARIVGRIVDLIDPEAT